MKLCRVKWLTGNLKDIVMETTVFKPKKHEIVKPYGCSGKFIILEILS